MPLWPMPPVTCGALLRDPPGGFGTVGKDFHIPGPPVSGRKLLPQCSPLHSFSLFHLSPSRHLDQETNSSQIFPNCNPMDNTRCEEERDMYMGPAMGRDGTHMGRGPPKKSLTNLCPSSQPIVNEVVCLFALGSNVL